MRQPALRAVTVVAMAMFPLAWAGSDMILERKDTQFLEVVELADRAPLVLSVSGLALHSALAVARITTRTDAPALILYVHLTSASAGLSGSFKHELTIPSAINEVRFGNAQVAIWRRKVR